MKKSLLIMLLFLGHLSFSQNEKTPALLASEFSEALTTEDFKKAYSYFSPSMAEQINAEKLAELWTQIQGQLGTVKEKQPIVQVTEDKQVLTYQPIQFENSLLDLKLAFDNNLQIIGMLFAPHKVFELDLMQTEHFFEEEIAVNSGKEIQLRGIMSLPKTMEKVPAIIFVHGSGPNDMDETVGPNKLFKDLAHKLAEKGIAVIRYEKRTKAYGGSPKLDINTLTLYEETIEDAISAVDLAAKDKRIDKKNIYVLGHSLGAMSAPRIGALSKRTKGIIMMAGNARPLQNLILEQYQYIFGEDGQITEEEQAGIDNYKAQLNALEQLEKTGNATGPLPLGLPPAYWLHLKDYDQVKTAKELEKPILVLQGKRDYQVTVEDFEIWKNSLANKQNVTFHLYEKLNHQMREGEGPCYPTEYEIKSQLPSYLVSDIAQWVLKRSGHE